MKYILPFLLIASAHAGPYVEMGVGGYFGEREYNCISDYDSRDTPVNGCSDNPLGSIAAGYSHKGFSLHLEHVSSLVEKDRGLNTLWLKYRHEFMK